MDFYVDLAGPQSVCFFGVITFKIDFQLLSVCYRNTINKSGNTAPRKKMLTTYLVTKQTPHHVFNTRLLLFSNTNHLEYHRICRVVFRSLKSCTL